MEPGGRIFGKIEDVGICVSSELQAIHIVFYSLGLLDAQWVHVSCRNVLLVQLLPALGVEDRQVQGQFPRLRLVHLGVWLFHQLALVNIPEVGLGAVLLPPLHAQWVYHVPLAEVV